jgi:hypothetical protein
MIDQRFRYAVMVAEDRARGSRDERSLQTPLRRVPRLPEPRPDRRRRWSFAAFVGLLVAKRHPR